MNKRARGFLEALLAHPSPSGYEGPVREIWKKEVAKSADKVTVDVHGNAIAVHNTQGDPRVMLAGHMDELGFQIIHIDDKGYLYFDTIGGFDLAIVPGRKVRIQTKEGPVLGVLGKKPVHLMTSEDRRKVVPKHELWIDLGVADAEEARQLVEIGDCATYDANFEILRGDLAVSRAFDNKMGAYIAAETLRRVKESKRKAKAAVYAVATCQEEIGVRGAATSTFGVDPLVGIALDVTWAMDHPGMDKRKVGEVKLGGGPVITRGANVNPVVFERLVEAAKKAKVPYQITAEPGGTGTDARAIQISRAGVATGLVSVALRYMHTPVEVLSLKDLDHTVSLLAEFILAIDRRTNFIP
jgi:putative aminopeptidase FrvX